MEADISLIRIPLYNKKTINTVYYFCCFVSTRQAARRAQHACFLPKERVCAKRDALLWCLVCAKYLFCPWQSNLYLKLLDFSTCSSINKRHVYADTHGPRKTVTYTQIYNIKTTYISIQSVHVFEKSKIQKKFSFCIYSLFPSISKYLHSTTLETLEILNTASCILRCTLHMQVWFESRH